VDIFYSHRPDPSTPLEETCGALAHAVRTGKALYAGISNYDPDQTARAAQLLREMGAPCLIHQPRYSMFERTPEQGLFDVLRHEGIGSIVFSPLAKGMLTNRYFSGIPADARAARDPRFLRPEHITDAVLAQTRQLDIIAQARGQTLAQMALAWVLRQPAVTSALIGASKVSQIEDNLGAIKNLAFDRGELAAIDRILAGP
jgi:L-glyceraldehyde 3-phosphate reductase